MIFTYMWSNYTIQNHRLNSVTFVRTFGKEVCFSPGVAEIIEYKPKATRSHLATA